MGESNQTEETLRGWGMNNNCVQTRQLMQDNVKSIKSHGVKAMVLYTHADGT
jgi:hypothetical protein